MILNKVLYTIYELFVTRASFKPVVIDSVYVRHALYILRQQIFFRYLVVLVRLIIDNILSLFNITYYGFWDIIMRQFTHESVGLVIGITCLLFF